MHLSSPLLPLTATILGSQHAYYGSFYHLPAFQIAIHGYTAENQSNSCHSTWHRQQQGRHTSIGRPGEEPLKLTSVGVPQATLVPAAARRCCGGHSVHEFAQRGGGQELAIVEELPYAALRHRLLCALLCVPSTVKGRLRNRLQCVRTRKLCESCCSTCIVPQHRSTCT